jgi:hypothetical protein
MIMPSRFFFLSFLVLASTVIHSKEPRCDSSEMGKGQGNFPKGISIDSIRRVTGIPANVCGMAMRAWPQEKGTFIVYTEDSATYSVFVLSRSKNAFKVEARLTGDFVGGYRFRKFDFAPYRVRKQSTAIGIRFARTVFEGGGVTDCEMLSLLERHGGELDEILFTPTRLEMYDNAGRGHLLEGRRAVIDIGDPDKSGYNRLIIKQLDDIETESSLAAKTYSMTGSGFYDKTAPDSTPAPEPLDHCTDY